MCQNINKLTLFKQHVITRFFFLKDQVLQQFLSQYEFKVTEIITFFNLYLSLVLSH